MNVEKKDRNIYTKELDPVDKYLVNIIKRFFQNDVETINNSAEAIIIEAVTRAKREIRLDGHYGVSSVNGKTGGVTLTAADVGAEPMIITKYSAFNKPFGISADTVCEGNDPRLSDTRDPNPHKHKAIDIITDVNHEFVTDVQIARWDAKADTTLATPSNDGLMSKEYAKKLEDLEADVAALPPDTGDGHNHIPSGGAITNILGWAAAGTAKWIDGTTLFLAKDGTAADSNKLGGHDPSWYLDYNNFTNTPPPSTPPTPPKADDGQVFFTDGDASIITKPAYTLYKALLTTNDVDLNASKGVVVDFATVFNTWKRFSHDATEVQPANVTDMNGWVYDTTKKQVICQNNAFTYIGFVCTEAEKTDNYALEATLSSTDGDDDCISIVIAFTTVAGREYTLSAVRARSYQSDDMVGGINAQWFIVYNYQRNDAKMIAHVTVPGETASTGWSSMTTGIKIKIERTGDTIKAWTSEPDGAAVLPASLLTVDLNSDPVLNKFRGPQQYGYGCYSQLYSTFSGINIISGDIIYDMEHNKVLVKKNGAWVTDSARTLDGDIGVGKFVFNDITQKLFYVSRDGVILVSINPDEYVKKDEINKMIDLELKAKGLIP